MADMTIPRLSGDAVANYEDINAAFAAAEQHGHGAITRDGKVGTAAGMLLGTGVDGAIEAKTAQQASNILQRSNPNILHNWDFRNPINQRGVSGVVDSLGYGIDRWTKVQGRYELTPAGIKFGGTDYAYNTHYKQIIENPQLFAGETVTFSAHVVSTSGSGSRTIRLRSGETWLATSVNIVVAGISSVTCEVPEGITNLEAWMFFYSNTETIIDVVKLEVGEFSTLANDPPMDCAVELVKCQRYFQLRSTNNVASVDMRPLMRINNPTVTGSGPYAYSADL